MSRLWIRQSSQFELWTNVERNTRAPAHAEPLVLRVAMGNELGDKKKQQHAQGICDMHMARSTAACTKWRNYMKELIGVGKGDMVGVKVSIRPFQATQKWSMMVG